MVAFSCVAFSMLFTLLVLISIHLSEFPWVLFWCSGVDVLIVPFSSIPFSSPMATTSRRQRAWTIVKNHKQLKEIIFHMKTILSQECPTPRWRHIYGQHRCHGLNVYPVWVCNKVRTPGQGCTINRQLLRIRIRNLFIRSSQKVHTK